MPAIWSSSESPISVRTVWVDGVRHAILTSDDPALRGLPKSRRRAKTSSGKQKIYPANYSCRESFDNSSAESLDSCFVKLHVVVEKRERENETSSRIIRRQSAPPQCNRGSTSNNRNLLELRLDGVLNFTGEYSNGSADEQSDQSVGRNSFRDSLNHSENNSRSTKNELVKEKIVNCVGDNFIAEIEEASRSTPEISNLLSERVLQWMDLSGRVTDYKTEDKDRQAKDCEQTGNLLKPKGYFRREYPPAKEQVVLQNYKMQTDRKSQDFDRRDVRVARKRISNERESFDKIMMNSAKGQLGNSANTEEEGKRKQIAKEEFNSGSQEPTKPLWSSVGRPQLHIFMPDLNSSGEDTSSEESLTKD